MLNLNLSITSPAPFAVSKDVLLIPFPTLCLFPFALWVSLLSSFRNFMKAISVAQTCRVPELPFMAKPMSVSELTWKLFQWLRHTGSLNCTVVRHPEVKFYIFNTEI